VYSGERLTTTQRCGAALAIAGTLLVAARGHAA
jgi:hypothetical protein